MWVAASAFVVCASDIPILSATLSRRAIVVPHQDCARRPDLWSLEQSIAQVCRLAAVAKTPNFTSKLRVCPNSPETKHLTSMQTAKNQLRLCVDPFGNQCVTIFMLFVDVVCYVTIVDATC
jgi:hypothetical protein